MKVYTNLFGNWKYVEGLRLSRDRIYIGKWVGFKKCSDITNIHILKITTLGLPADFNYVETKPTIDCTVGRASVLFSSRKASRPSILKVLICLLFRRWGLAK